jgi:hypothetical protein
LHRMIPLPTHRRGNRPATRLAAVLACTAPLLMLTGCSLFPPWRQQQPPAAPAPAKQPPSVVSRNGLAPITDEQVERIRSQIDTRAPSPAVENAVRSAAPTIESFLRTEGCITARNGAVLNPFAAPGRLFGGPGFAGGPMTQMQYHDKTACVTVKRIQNWKMPTRQLLRFDVVYVGDDGEERALEQHELKRQPQGGWRFTR